MVKYKNAILTMALLIILASSKNVSAKTFGNFLDVTWRLPEPKGAPQTACEKDIQDMYRGLRNMTLWAYEMWDASARAPSGALHGSHFHLGNFDQCLGVTQGAIPGDGSAGPPRQYCLINVEMHPVPPRVYPLEIQPNGSVYNKIYNPGNFAEVGKNIAYWGLCTPASCRLPELLALIQMHFHDESVRIAEQSATVHGSETEEVRHEFRASIPLNGCQKADDPQSMTYGAVTFFILLGTLLTAVALATTYHYSKQLQNEKDNECPPVIKAFSLFNNLKKLNQNEMGSELQILNGLRVVSTIFVVLGHRFIGIMAGPIANRGIMDKNHSHVPLMIMTHGDLVVDTFLLMSGLLLIYKLLEWNTKNPLPITSLVFYRYIRLVPVYAFVILFTSQALPLFGSGPLWPMLIDIEVNTCRANWWTNLLMINNYVNSELMCLIPAWYIPVDFHFFIISLGIIWLLSCRPSHRPGLFCLGVLLLVSILLPGFITYFHQLPATLTMDIGLLNNPRFQRTFQVYVKSHNRASSYLIGLLTGYLLVRYYKPGKQLISTKWSTLLTAASVAVLFGVMWLRILLYNPMRPYSALEAALYAALHRPVWATAMSVLIACCLMGNIPAVSGFLGWSFFTPLARLVYGVFLFHNTLQIMEISIIRTPRFMDNTNLLYLLIPDLAVSLLASLVMYLTVEAPLTKLIFMLKVTRKSKNVTSSSNPPNPGVSQTTNKFNEQMKNDGRPGLRHR